MSPEEIRMNLAAKRNGKSSSEGELSIRKIDPKLLAKLDEEIYELIILLPKTDQEKIGVERLRGFIRDRIGRYTTMKEKTRLLREAKNILPKFNEPERGEVLGTFFNIKDEKENAIEIGRTEAKIKLATIGGIFFALIMTIAAFSLILVLLAIERNIRKA